MKSTNVYTVMLMLSLLFLTVASVLLLLELSRFGGVLRSRDTSSAQPVAPVN